MSLQRTNRVAAWTALMIIVVLTVVPPGLRPVTVAQHGIEHAAAFLLAEWILTAGAIIFCAAIEAVQLYVPGRHARISDLIVDAAAGITGVLVNALARHVAANFAKP